MAWEDSGLEYEYDPEDIDEVIDERGNQAIILRKVRWKPDGEFKLDLRKYVFNDEGEKPLKGISFLTEDGPDDLTNVLLREGYGAANIIAKTISENRPDIVEALKHVDDEEDVAYDVTDEELFGKVG